MNTENTANAENLLRRRMWVQEYVKKNEEQGKKGKNVWGSKLSEFSAGGIRIAIEIIHNF